MAEKSRHNVCQSTRKDEFFGVVTPAAAAFVAHYISVEHAQPLFLS